MSIPEGSDIEKGKIVDFFGIDDSGWIIDAYSIDLRLRLKDRGMTHVRFSSGLSADLRTERADMYSFTTLDAAICSELRISLELKRKREMPVQSVL